ncbi:MAG TPA: amidohydrolase family protein [Tepidisphaeraceae bacterium]|nr:amidohydrolase family protein [Tepidisphaeraceae bacterium]
MDRSQLIRARSLATMEPNFPDLIDDGAVLVRGNTIERVGRFDEMSGEVARADVIDLGESLLMPGLINAHTHLCLSQLKQSDAPAQPFTDWILSIATRSGRGSENYEANLLAGIEEGVRQCMTFGVTTVGDITLPLASQRRAILQSPLRVRSFIEALGLGSSRNRFEEALRNARDDSDETDRFTTGISPHAPYTVDRAGFVECVALGKQITTHLAETLDEREFLNHHAGAFRHVYDKLGTSLDGAERYSGSPVRLMYETGVLDSRALFAHVNYVDDSDLDLLAQGNSSVVFCPRTHEFFRHAPHRFPEMLSRGINVCLGTDSCASSPDLNLLDDARLVARLAPQLTAREILKMITIRGAHALRLEAITGSIRRAKCADLCAFDVGSLEELLNGNVMPTAVWVDGIRVG